MRATQKPGRGSQASEARRLAGAPGRLTQAIPRESNGCSSWNAPKSRRRSAPLGRVTTQVRELAGRSWAGRGGGTGAPAPGGVPSRLPDGRPRWCRYCTAERKSMAHQVVGRGSERPSDNAASVRFDADYFARHWCRMPGRSSPLAARRSEPPVSGQPTGEVPSARTGGGVLVSEFAIGKQPRTGPDLQPEGYRKAAFAENFRCHRPGCYDHFVRKGASWPRQIFCSRLCRQALRRVLLREQQLERSPELSSVV